MNFKEKKTAISIDLLMVTLVFVLTLLLLFTSSCKHEPRILPSSDLTTENNGNGGSGGNGNGNQQLTCDPDSIYFQKTILPLIVSSCSKSGCHDAASHQDGVVLDNYQNIMNHGAINPGNPGSSELYEAITENDPDKIMPPPPASPMKQSDIDMIATWIRQGARNNTCSEGSCDTLNVTFSSSINSLIQSNCVGCHNGSLASGQVNLEGYSNVKATAQNGSLLGSISHSTGFFPMPKGISKLSDCEIAMVRIWIDQGSPNN